MASKVETRVQFSSADTVSISSGGNATSDTFTPGAGAWKLGLTLKAKNAGSPASGDYLTIWLLPSAGDPDGATATHEFSTSSHGIPLVILDTNLEDPAIDSIPIPTEFQDFQLYIESNAASNSITFSAVLTKQRES